MADTTNQARDAITEAELADWFAAAQRRDDVDIWLILVMPDSDTRYPPCPGCGGEVAGRLGAASPAVWRSFGSDVVWFQPCGCRLAVEGGRS